MNKKIITRILCFALCLSMTACGSGNDRSGSSGDESSGSGTGTSAVTLQTEKPAGTEALTEKPEETEAQTEKPAETEAPSESEPVKEGMQLVKGTGYTVELSDKWIDATDYQKSSGELKKLVSEKLGFDPSSVESMDVMYFFDDGDLDNGAPAFSVAKPIRMPGTESAAVKDLNKLMAEAMVEQAKSMEGVSFEVIGDKTVNNAEFMEAVTAYDLPELQAKARQYFTFNKGSQYIISFSIPTDQYDAMSDEIDMIINTFTFMEEKES